MGTLEERVQALETLLSAAAGTAPYNSLHTGPQIDEAVSRALPGGDIDQTMAPLDSPAFTGSPTINGVPVATGQGGVGQSAIGRNMLDNWYFGNPVDQRGVSGTISDPGYFIDRWKLISGTVQITQYGLLLNGTISQILEDSIGCPTKATALASDGVFDAVYDDAAKTFSITASGKTIIAAKLELGDQQTLAHQDANGNWVLNEIPDYGEQLRRCQRYFCIIGSSYMPAVVAAGNVLMSQVVFLPVTMRATPSLSFAALSYKFNNSEWVRIDAPTEIYNNLGSFGFDYRSSSFQDGKAGWIYFAKCEASADL